MKQRAAVVRDIKKQRDDGGASVDDAALAALAAETLASTSTSSATDAEQEFVSLRKSKMDAAVLTRMDLEFGEPRSLAAIYEDIKRRDCKPTTKDGLGKRGTGKEKNHLHSLHTHRMFSLESWLALL